MLSANCPNQLHSLLSWTHCLHGSLQPEGSFDHCGINSARSLETVWSATEIVRSKFLSGCRQQSIVILWEHCNLVLQSIVITKHCNLMGTVDHLI